MTLEAICKELKNWFTKDKDKYFGTFTIAGGVITPSDFLKPDQYFRIVGSIFNDGVYQYRGAGVPIDGLMDEEFSDGAVWAMSGDVFKVASNLNILNDWIESNKNVIQSPYTSESFAGYSYSKSTGNNATSVNEGNIPLMQKINELFGRYRKVREL